MGVQQLKLLGYRLGYHRVAVPNRGNVVVHIQVLNAICIEQARPHAANQMQRLLVEKAVARPKHLSTRNQIMQIALKRIKVRHVEAVRLKNSHVFALLAHMTNSSLTMSIRWPIPSADQTYR